MEVFCDWVMALGLVVLLAGGNLITQIIGVTVICLSSLLRLGVKILPRFVSRNRRADK